MVRFSGQRVDDVPIQHNYGAGDACTMEGLTAQADRRTPMYILILAGVLVVLTTAYAIRKSRVPSAISSSNLGEVSEQWLAEHRASHPL